MANSLDLVWLALLFPLLGLLYSSLVGHAAPRSSGIVASLAVGASFVIAIIVLFGLLALPPEARHHEIALWNWIPIGTQFVPVGLLVDPLSTIMLLVVTGVGFVIHVYATGYMHGDPGYSRFFAYLNLFVLAMLVLVLANNFLLLMVGWGGVGLSSYLLISFWYERPEAASAGVKAFVINAIGDVGLLIAVFVIFVTFGQITYEGVFAQAAQPAAANAVIAITLLLLVAAVAKSGQVPLHVWLPDAMAGPTPVSALIHAATMVTAGVYLIARAYPLFEHAPVTMVVVAVIGAITALLAATVGLVQWNIKRVLAYSTVSQLGLMFVAAGVGAFTAGIFHLITHAFFKALLFLAAGAVIHALHGEEDMRYMGGLRNRLPLTFATFAIGAAAISGVPLLSGFFSKEEIISAAFANNLLLGLVTLVVTLLTAFYMFRALFLTFYGQAHPEQDRLGRLHAPGATMTVPLIVLAFFSVVAGYLPFTGFLEPTFARFGEPHHGELNVLIMGAATVVALAGIAGAYLFYVVDRGLPKRVSSIGGGAPYKIASNAYFFDHAYSLIFILPTRLTSWLLDVVDQYVIDGAVNGVARVVRTAATGVGRIQTGYVRNYALAMLVGTIVIVGYLMRVGG
jgi:NADH-quinone oxidoreductase subunit L